MVVRSSEERGSVLIVGVQSNLSSFFTSDRFAKIGSIGLVTQSGLGLALFPLLYLNAIATPPIIPIEYGTPLFAYVGYLIITLLIWSIVSFTRSKVKGKACHYCGGALEIHGYKCKNPDCGKVQ